MKYLTYDLFSLCCRSVRRRRCSCGLQRVLLALGMLGIVSATSLNAVELVSVNKDSTDSGNGYASYEDAPPISADGRFVAFVSEADDLVAADTNGKRDVFVRDRQSGTTTLVSVNKDGTDSGTGESNLPTISADGRFVAFSSRADDLVAIDGNSKWDVFVRDLQSGTTTLVSFNKDGTNSGISDSGYCDCGHTGISADGRFVVFFSWADDLVATDTNDTIDLFVRDLQSGTTTLVSVNKDGTDSGHGYSLEPVISADGRFVAFVSGADDLVATDTNGNGDVFVRDLQNGTTTLVTINKNGADSGAGQSRLPVINADGRFVAFVSWADDLVATDTNGTVDVFVRDLQNETTTLVSVNKDGTDSGAQGGFLPFINADGRFVAFESAADDLVATDSNGLRDIFVRDLQSGTTTLVSVNKDGTDSGNDWSYAPEISTDGRIVAFVSRASDLVVTDTNGAFDVFAFEVFEAPQGCNCADPGAIKGTAGPDFLYGTEQADIICGFGDRDFIAGMGGDDCIDGGDGNDWIDGGSGDDRIFGRAGKDVIYGSRGNDEITGDENEDFLFGGTGDDKLDGGKGYDWIFCGSGTDEGIGEQLRGCEN